MTRHSTPKTCISRASTRPSTITGAFWSRRRPGVPDLHNRDLDTGELTRPAEYTLADDAYAKLVTQLAEKKFCPGKARAARGHSWVLRRSVSPGEDKERRSEMAEGAGGAQSAAKLRRPPSPARAAPRSKGAPSFAFFSANKSDRSNAAPSPQLIPVHSPNPIRGRPSLLRISPKRDLVSIFQKCPRLPRGQPHRLAAMLHFQQAAFRTFLRPGDGAGREQIAGTQIAAVAGVMRHELRRSPIQIAKIAAAQQHGVACPPAASAPTADRLRASDRSQRCRRIAEMQDTASGAGSPPGRSAAGTRYGASASMVTTHGEMVVAKFFARNGPSG